MRFLTALFLVLLALLSGCVSDSGDGAVGPGSLFGPPPLSDPEASFKDLAEKSEGLPDGYYKYSVDVYLAQPVEHMYDVSSSFNAEIFKLGSSSKKVVHMGAAVEYLERDGKLFMCTPEVSDNCFEFPAVTDAFGSQTGLSYFGLFKQLYLKGDDTVSFSYLGGRTVGNRGCYEFSFGVSREKMQGLSGLTSALASGVSAQGLSMPFDDSRLEYRACLDAQYGFVASYRIEAFKLDEQGQESKAMSMGAELLEFSQSKVSQEDFRFPVDLTMSGMECGFDGLEVTLKSWNDFSGKLDLWFVKDWTLSSSEERELKATDPHFTVQFEANAGESGSFFIELGEEPEEGDHILLICTEEGHCIEGECDYESIPDYADCVDSDGGGWDLSLYVKGSVSFTNHGRPGVYEDQCQGGYGLVEWYCSDNKPNSREEPCDCADGVCVDPYCFDSDGGRWYPTSNAVEKGVCQSDKGSITDTCESETVLKEAYCTNTTAGCLVKNFDCVNDTKLERCIDGKCE